MINKIKINNFQSHKNSEIFFTEGINVIVGSSNHGKSAIIKAMLKVFNNRPQGDAFVSFFKEKKESMKIEMGFPEGIVIREKGKNFDGYIIGKEKYEALRTKVPEQVQDLTRMYPVNIQEQKDQFFLLDKSPGEVGKFFNKVVGLDEMTSVLKKSNDETRNLTAIVKNQEQEIQETQEKIKEKKWILEAQECYNKIKKTKETLQRIQDKKESILDLIQAIKRLANKINSIDVSDLQKCKEIEKQLKTDKEELKSLQNSESALSRLAGSLVETQNKLSEYKYIPEQEKALFALSEALSELETIKNKKEAIKKIISKEKRIKEEMKSIDIEKYQKRIDAFLKETGVCPLCGGAL